MTLQEAKTLRDQYLYLIGQKAKNLELRILDVIVIPIDNFQKFITKYRNKFSYLSNDELLTHFPSKQYDVKVIIDDNQGLINILSDDILEYYDYSSD